MENEQRIKRIRKRLELQLPVRVTCRETPDLEWVEITRLVDVTPFGAGFTLKRPVERGRLLHLTIPMPRQLRVFDHVEDQYRIWALVRYLRPLGSGEEQTPLFEVGVAFVGKRPPSSHKEDPAKRYDIAESVTDATHLLDQKIGPLEQSTRRAHTRHNIPEDLLLEVLDEKGVPGASENTVTENISEKGATVFTTLTIPVGRFVRLTSRQYNNMKIYAAVRSRSTGADGIPRIHVEFIDRRWPL